MKSYLVGLLTIAGAACLKSLDNDSLVVTAPAGSFRGVDNKDGTLAWLGIRYAEPPVGRARFLPAKVARPLDSAMTYNASSFSPSCPQNSLDLQRYKSRVSINNFAEGEDCLSLNIWKQAGPTAPSDKKAVLVWFATTGLNIGTTNIARYRGNDFVRDQEGIMIVTVNSRVGIFGFPQTPGIALSEHNAGLRDQRLAVQWLHENIEAFGGDPGRIVIMGDSFGAAAVGLWTYAYKDHPLVSGVIQGGSSEPIGMSILGPPNSVEKRLALFDRVANASGCPLVQVSNEQDAWAAQVSCMQAIDWRRIQAVASEHDESHHDFSPVIDGTYVFSALQYAEFASQGSFARIPSLVGSNNREADDIISGSQDLKDSITKLAFTCPIAKVAHYRSMYNPTWRYMYSGIWPNINRDSAIGAAELYELSMIFGTYNQSVSGVIDGKVIPKIESTAGQIGASRTFQNAIAAFVRDPVKGLTALEWPKYDTFTKSLVELGLNNQPDMHLSWPAKYDFGCVP